MGDRGQVSVKTLEGSEENYFSPPTVTRMVAWTDIQHKGSEFLITCP